MLRSREAPALGREGRYRPLRQISEDPIGSLWLAEDVALGVEVSVRVLRKDLGANQRFRRVLRAELRRVWPLRHPHIANVISYTDAEGPSDFFVLQALRGESLAARLLRGGLDPSEAATVASQVEMALDAAHTIGIVHGVLTAHSVLLTPDDGVKVIDFGIPTALGLTAREAPRPVLDASKDRGFDLVFDPSQDARCIEVLTRMMLCGTDRSPDGELPILIDQVLAATSGATGPRRRSVREALRFHAGDRHRRSRRIVARRSKPRSPRLVRSDRSRHRRPIVKGISSSATAIWRLVLGSCRRVARPILDGARAIVVLLAGGLRAGGRALSSISRRIARRVTPAATAPSAHPGGTPTRRPPDRTRTAVLAGATLVAIIATTTAAITLFDGSRSTVVRPDGFEAPTASATTASARGLAPSSSTGVIVPDVRQLTAMQASELLSRAGLVVVDAKPMPGPPGEVVGTDPAPRLLVAPGAEVVLFVGASPDRVEEES